jgi:hypothetical protein
VAEDLKKNQPAYENRTYGEMQRAWKIVRDVCEGTLRLRDLKSEYLPMEEAEDSKDYAIRLSRAIFFNAFERTLHGLVGMVFRKEPKLAKDVPEIIRGRERVNEQEELGLLRQIAQIALNFEWNPDQARQNDAGLWTRIVAFFARLVVLVGQYREWLNGPRRHERRNGNSSISPPNFWSRPGSRMTMRIRSRRPWRIYRLSILRS